MQNKQEKVPTYPIGSVNNALRLLLMFRDHPLIRVSEAGVALGVAPSTAHRLLAMLEYHGFVQQDEETRGYRSGPALVDIGLTAVRSIDVRDALGHPRAALAVSAPLARVQGQRVPELAEALKRTAGEASAGLA